MGETLKVEGYAKKVRNALGGRYAAAMEPQIASAASAWRTMELANADIDSLECVSIATPQGLKAHPAFKIRTDAETSLGRHLKALGLTAEALGGESDADPMAAMLAEVAAASRRKPKKKAKA